jgi:GPH family glycoside/pentoside/hexuronide:cation symporter
LGTGAPATRMLSLAMANALFASAGAAPKEAADAGPGIALSRMLAFISPVLPLGAVVLPLTLYLPAYYSSYVGLSLSVVGLCFFAVRSLDIGLDPVVGWVVDRTHTRWGQCRPWMAAGAALTMAAVLMLFLGPPGASAAYLIIGLLLIYGGISMLGVAQPAWAARLAPGYDERSKLYAWMQVAGSTGALLLLSLPMIAALSGHTDAGSELHLMGLGLGAVLPVTMAWALWRTPEPKPPAAHLGADGRVRFIDYALLLKRPNVLRLVIGDLFVSLGTATSSTLFLFFWHSARGYSGAETSFIILMYYLASVVTVPAWVRVVRRIGKRAAFMISGMGFVLFMPMMAFLPRHRLEIVVPAMCLVGLTFSAATFLIRAMAADAADEARLATGVDRLGQIYGLLASTAKLGSAIAVGVAFPLMEWVGFKPSLGDGNSPGALLALTLVYVGAPALSTFLGVLAMAGYRLSADDHARVRERLADRDAETREAD